MARPRMTIEQAQLKGADKVNPARFKDRKAAAKSDLPLGDAPSHLSSDAQSCWFELSTYAIPGTLTGSDRMMLELASVLLAEFREDTKEFTAAKFNQLKNILTEFGMSPVARQKLGVGQKKSESNEFEDLDS